MLNVVALRGRLMRPAEVRSLPNGTSVLGLELSVRREGEDRADSVPVVLYDPPDGSTSALEVDAELVVVGHVARRFFRTAGGTQSRTEVVASAVHPARSAKRVAGAFRGVVEAVESAASAAAAGGGGGRGSKGGGGRKGAKAGAA